MVGAPTLYVTALVWRFVKKANQYPEGRAGYTQARLDEPENAEWTQDDVLASKGKIGIGLASFALG